MASAVVVVLAGCGGPDRQAPPTGAVADQADRRATAAADRHETGMTCVARTFGLDPATATEIGQVKTVYAWLYCRDQDGGGSELVPAAITATGVDIPSDDNYETDVERIFPPDVRSSAYEPPKAARDLAGSLPPD
jgi:hypothetical protein